MSANWPNRLIALAVIAVVIASTWILGKRNGAREAYAVAATRLSSAEAQSMIEQLQTQLRESELNLEQANRSIEAGAARTQSLQRSLEEQMRLSSVDMRDLALYRRIENGEKARRSVDVDSITWTGSKPEVLEVTLIQWLGRDRLSGELSVSLVYSEQGNNGLADSESAVQATIDEPELIVDLPVVEFDFRFFQKFSIPITSDFADTGTGKPLEPAPDYVDVRIRSTDARVLPVDTRLAWIDIAE